jgi:hypothetical protein
MTNSEKVEHIARNFDQLSENQKEYIKNLSQALYFIQKSQFFNVAKQDILAVQEINNEKGLLHDIFEQSPNSSYISIRQNPIKGGTS